MRPSNRPLRTSPCVLLAAVLACAACNSDTDNSMQMDGSTTGSSTTTGGSASESSSASHSGESTEGEADSSSGSGTSSGCDASFSEVSWFQVVEVPAWIDGALVEPDARPVPLIDGRDAALRVYVERGKDGPVDLTVHVDVMQGGQSERFSATATISGPDDALIVEVPANAMNADASYTVSMDECDDMRIPQTGETALGAVTTGPLRVHLVPFEVDGFTPDTTQPVLEGYREALLALYPVTDVELTVLPVEADQGGGQLDMDALMTRLITLQEDLVFATGDVDPTVADIYYYGMVTGAATREEFCDSCPTGTSESGNGDRAGSAIGASFADELSESTLVHEFGHMHGLLHSPCGDPSLQDPDFPYSDGATATEGWDRRTSRFVPASHNDVMGYCQPRWVSDYHYAKMVQWVQRAQSWADGTQAALPSRRLSCSTNPPL